MDFCFCYDIEVDVPDELDEDLDFDYYNHAYSNLYNILTKEVLNELKIKDIKTKYKRAMLTRSTLLFWCNKRDAESLLTRIYELFKAIFEADQEFKRWLINYEITFIIKLLAVTIDGMDFAQGKISFRNSRLRYFH